MYIQSVQKACSVAPLFCGSRRHGLSFYLIIYKISRSSIFREKESKDVTLSFYFPTSSLDTLGVMVLRDGTIFGGDGRNPLTILGLSS